jgi:hypothetical protein
MDSELVNQLFSSAAKSALRISSLTHLLTVHLVRILKIWPVHIYPSASRSGRRAPYRCTLFRRLESGAASRCGSQRPCDMPTQIGPSLRITTRRRTAFQATGRFRRACLSRSRSGGAHCSPDRLGLGAESESIERPRWRTKNLGRRPLFRRANLFEDVDGQPHPRP